MRNGKDQSAKEARAASKTKAAAARRARRKAAAPTDSRSTAAEGKAKKTEPGKSVASSPALTAAAAAEKPAAATAPQKGAPAEAPIISPEAAVERGAIGPMLPSKAVQPSGERRRWPERHGPAISHGDPRRGAADHRGDGGEGGEPAPRANKLMPTNAVHPTERRTKRRVHQNRALAAAAAAALLGVLILSNQSEPPELVLGGRQTASRAPTSDDWPSDISPHTAVEAAPGRASAHAGSTPEAAATDAPALPTTATQPSHFAAAADVGGPSGSEIFEIQQFLARLDLSASEPDGVVDAQTRLAIRLYQKFAGLPVDGEPSAALLADMREVVKMMEARN